MSLRRRADRLAAHLARRHPDVLTDDQRAARIAALAERAAAGDPDAIRRYRRVQQLLELARARLDDDPSP